jgi:hypothetical protein
LISTFSTSSCLLTSSKREINISFDFNVDFDTTDVVVQSASTTSASGEANVGTYIKACKCDNLESFKCNTNPIGPNSILYVCLTSIDPDVEIRWLDRLSLFQYNAIGNETMNIVASANIQNEEISTMIVKNSTAVGVATVVPSRFFSYSGVSSLDMDVFGTVEMNLVGGRRRLADAVSPDAPFEINIEVERSDEAIPDVEWTADHVQSGSKKNGFAYSSFVGGSVCFVLASFVLL